jgi:hypothetical protein
LASWGTISFSRMTAPSGYLAGWLKYRCTRSRKHINTKLRQHLRRSKASRCKAGHQLAGCSVTPLCLQLWLYTAFTELPLQALSIRKHWTCWVSYRGREGTRRLLSGTTGSAYLWFRLAMITHFNIAVVIFLDWFLRIWLRPRGWHVALCTCHSQFGHVRSNASPLYRMAMNCNNLTHFVPPSAVRTLWKKLNF